MADFFKKGGSPVNSAAWVRIWQEQNNYFLQSNKEYTVFSLEYGISNIFEMICKPLGKKHKKTVDLQRLKKAQQMTNNLYLGLPDNCSW